MVRISRASDENFSCPHCGTEYRMILRSPARDSGSATCEVCRKVMVEWTDAAIPSFAMKIPADDR